MVHDFFIQHILTRLACDFDLPDEVEFAVATFSKPVRIGNIWADGYCINEGKDEDGVWHFTIGVLGSAGVQYAIETTVHEFAHVKQWLDGDLTWDGRTTHWHGQPCMHLPHDQRPPEHHADAFTRQHTPAYLQGTT
jgi:hypothetical protein